MASVWGFLKLELDSLALERHFYRIIIGILQLGHAVRLREEEKALAFPFQRPHSMAAIYCRNCRS